MTRQILKILTIGLLLSVHYKCAFGQGDLALLTDNEAEILNSYFEDRGAFDFKDKRIAFVSGSTGKTLITKREYFDNIKKWSENDSRIATSLFILTDKERIESGNYDAIVTVWVKILTFKRRKIIVRNLGNYKEGY